MSEEQLTIEQVLLSSEEETGDASTEERLLEEVKAATEKVGEEVKATWPVMKEILIEKIKELLNIDIPDIMTNAWSKYAILQQYTDRDYYPPEETYFVELADHTINSEHYPQIDVTVNGQVVTTIHFYIVLALNLKGLVLRVQDGRIKGIAAGDCLGRGSLYCENRLLVEKETRSFKMPGALNLREGIPIVKAPIDTATMDNIMR